MSLTGKTRQPQSTIALQKASALGTLLFFTTVALVLYQGWQIRDIAYLTAESGLGYALGIVGGVMMLLLLLYPLRKRLPSLRVLGPIKYWFRLHMIFGVLGPTLILFHCNFHLGALNSNIALFCMSIVAASGLLGRYFYARIHHGLYGSQATLHELQQESKWQFDQVVNSLPFFRALEEELKTYEASAYQAGRGLFSFISIPLLTIQTHFAYHRLWRSCKLAIRNELGNEPSIQQHLTTTRVNLRTYFRAVRKVAEFGFYSRLFSAWHVLHLPLFVMMLITGIVHVIAVHMY